MQHKGVVGIIAVLTFETAFAPAEPNLSPAVPAFINPQIGS